MIDVLYAGKRIGSVPLFLWKKGDTYVNFLRRILIGGKGEPLPEYFSILKAYRIPGGICIILWMQHIIVAAPWPRLIND